MVRIYPTLRLILVALDINRVDEHSKRVNKHVSSVAIEILGKYGAMATKNPFASLLSMRVHAVYTALSKLYNLQLCRNFFVKLKRFLKRPLPAAVILANSCAKQATRLFMHPEEGLLTPLRKEPSRYI